MSQIPNFLGGLPQFVAATPQQSSATQRLALFLEQLANNNRINAQKEIAAKELEGKLAVSNAEIASKDRAIASQEGIAANQLEAQRASDLLNAGLKREDIDIKREGLGIERDRLDILDRGNELDVLSRLAGNPNFLPEQSISLLRDAGIDISPNLITPANNSAVPDSVALPDNIEELDSFIASQSNALTTAPAGQIDRITASIRAAQGRRETLDARRRELKGDDRYAKEVERDNLKTEASYAARASDKSLDYLTNQVDTFKQGKTDLATGFGILDLREQIKNSPLDHAALSRDIDNSVVPVIQSKIRAAKLTDIYGKAETATDRVNNAKIFLENSKKAGLSNKELMKKKTEILTDLSRVGQRFTKEEVQQELPNYFRSLSGIRLTDKDKLPFPKIETFLTGRERVGAGSIRTGYKITGTEYLTPEQWNKKILELEEGKF